MTAHVHDLASTFYIRLAAGETDVKIVRFTQVLDTAITRDTMRS